LNTNVTESKNLLFYDFNSGARKFTFGTGNGVRLATRGEFRRTGMAGAKFIDHDIIETNDLDSKQPKRRPTTSHFRGGDRLPSRASKTREKVRKLHIGGANKKPIKTKQQVIKKKIESSPSVIVDLVNNNHRNERLNIHTAMPAKNYMTFEDFNSTEEIPKAPKIGFRERMNRKKDIIIEEQEDYEEDHELSIGFS
jgi:hypothetical protein